ncbi:hypothetical protein [Butyrivibrio sp. VCB2001]|uniref:hypothetical protein n=1 Tax=Butyrivibrio sp. VCB2001 TaxID=1280667 RepID=UPI00047D73D6|nr:hypothetical protein [Butyrivibrio sp. VCB2001]
MTRKQILRSVIFIVLVLWMVVHLTYILRTNGDVKDRFVGFNAEKNDTIDALVIGSSPVAPCFITPKIYGDMGITMYPLSSNMQRPVASKYLLEEALKTQSPDLVIFEMRMWTARDEDLLGNMAHTREVTDNMKYSLNRIKAINAMVDDESDRINYYFDIFKYHSNWKTLFLWSQFRTLFYTYPDDLKGHVIETDVGPAERPADVPLTVKEPIPSEQEEYLLDLLEYLKEKNQKALFVVTPYSSTEDEQKKINYISELISSKGYDFLDMNLYVDEMGLDFEKDIRDYGTHVNIVGGEKITDWFENYLKENYVDTGAALTVDHRGDKKYSSWDKAYQLWENLSIDAREKVRYNIENKIYYELETD